MAVSPWYREGIAKFTEGSTTVTGTDTEWAKFVRAGDGIQGPDGNLYQVTNVASDTALSIYPAYGSETQYWTIPIQGYVKQLADSAAQLLRDYEGGASEALEAADRAETAAAAANTSKTQSEIEAGRAKTEANRAETEADRAQQAADDAVAVVTDGGGSIEPEAGKWPIAGSDGKINSGWIDFENEDLDKVIEKKIFERGVGASDAIGVALVAREGNGGELVHVNNQLQVIDVPDGFFDKHDVFSGIEHVVIDGQDMIRIPKFYVKSVDTYIQGYDDLCPVWLVSSSKGVGYQIHPAFMNNGEEIDQIYIGKYQASLGDEGLRSVPGALPSVNRTIVQFRSDAEKRNTGGVEGFMLWSVWQWSAIQVLYLIENATFNSQAKTGQGRVSASSAAEVDAEDVAQATYRGMVGLWGNVNQWLDGLAWQGHTFRVWDQSGNKTLIDTGVTRGDVGAAVYPDYLYRGVHGGVDMSLLFIGESGKSSNSNATIPDSQYVHASTGTYFPPVGGSWGSGSSAGLWRLYVGLSSAYALGSIGGRLAKI